MKKIWLVLLLTLFSAPAWPAEALTKYSIVLLQPQSVLEQRVPDIPALAGYIQAVEAAGRAALQNAKPDAAHSGFIVLAVRPNGKARAWLDFAPALPPAESEALLAAIRAVKPFSARNGTVVFALKVGVWGGQAPERNVPAPAEWQAAAKKAGSPMEISALVDSIWRE